jgi:6-phosphogluconate dehydrogenase
MKTTLFILVLFFFTFTLESSTIEEISPKEGDKILIMHNTGNGFVEIEISISALKAHLNHGDSIIDGGGGGGCEPPAC